MEFHSGISRVEEEMPLSQSSQVMWISGKYTQTLRCSLVCSCFPDRYGKSIRWFLEDSNDDIRNNKKLQLNNILALQLWSGEIKNSWKSVLKQHGVLAKDATEEKTIFLYSELVKVSSWANVPINGLRQVCSVSSTSMVCLGKVNSVSLSCKIRVQAIFLRGKGRFLPSHPSTCPS